MQCLSFRSSQSHRLHRFPFLSTPGEASSNSKSGSIRDQTIVQKKMVEQRVCFRRAGRQLLAGTVERVRSASCVLVRDWCWDDRKLKHLIPAVVTKCCCVCCSLANHSLPVNSHCRIRPPIGPRSVLCSSALFWTWKKRFSCFVLFLTCSGFRCSPYLTTTTFY